MIEVFIKPDNLNIYIKILEPLFGFWSPLFWFLVLLVLVRRRGKMGSLAR